MLKSENYIEYLETVVKSLLEERNDVCDTIKITDTTENPCYKGSTFSVHNIEGEIKEQEKNRKNLPTKDELLSKIAYLTIRYAEMWHAEQEIKRREMEITEEQHKSLYEWYEINEKDFNRINDEVRNLIKSLPLKEE